MRIEYPTPEEQRTSVGKIVKTGMAHRRSLFADIAEMYRDLGLRVIFHDMADIVFIAAISSVITLFYLLEDFSANRWQHDEAYAILFAAAPTLYLLLCLLGFWKEKLSDTYDVKMTCKYTVCHLTAFRMLVFSCVCILINLAVVGIFCMEGIFPDFWHAFFVAASSLFLFSFLLLRSLFHSKGLAAPTVTAAAWIPANFLVYSLFRNGYSRFLRDMPLCLHAIVALLLACLYCADLKRLILQQKERILC